MQMHFSVVPTGPPQQGKKGLMEAGAFSAISSSIFFLAYGCQGWKGCDATIRPLQTSMSLLLHSITHATQHACHRAVEASEG
ncbi:unnamed protein product [Symbiodinium natans]|uniref:Uncharacterized protein n=1 Tax=Symbiodinium natans TaxID=878477 RepID=A0A812TYK3_9DINO|nr:unnamed protein product [Symbiodinium natans]